MQLLDHLPVWVLAFLTGLVTVAAIEVGYRFGAWHSQEDRESEAPVGTIVASVLGLLAFLIGFVFQFAAGVFNERKVLVLDEANAIGTCYLRAQMLPSGHARRVSKLLIDYVDGRLPGNMTLAEAIQNADRLQDDLWAETVAVASDKNANMAVVLLYVQSMNEVIDLHSKRVMAGLYYRVPAAVWLMLYVVLVLGMAAVGYQMGLSGKRRSRLIAALVFVFAAVFWLIADLDRPSEGLFRTSLQPLIDLQAKLKR